MRYKKKQNGVALDIEVCIRLILAGISLTFIFLTGNLWNIQLSNGAKYKDLAQKNRIRRIIIPARRGNIYDRHGALLVENRPSFNITITKEDFKEYKNNILSRLPKLLDLSEEKITSRIYSKSYFSYMPSQVARDITLEQLTAIEEASPSLPGVMVEIEPVRSYKYGNFLAHLIGKVGNITSDQYEKWKQKGYIMQDIVGKMGVEEAYESYLRGVSGGMQVQVDHRGFFDEIINIREPLPGNNVYLTIDKNVQDVLEEVYLDKAGAGVVLNPSSGEVLGMVSKPDFDPNIFVSHKSVEEVKNILHDPTFPLVNKAISGEYPAGSIFKIIVALAALKTKVITDKTTFLCNGVFHLGKASFKCWRGEGHGTVDIRYALMQSCNVFFYNCGKLLTEQPIYEMGKEFGLGEITEIELAGEKKGILPNAEWKQTHINEPWYGGDSINYSIGQGYLLLTPLQLAVMMSAVANEGTLYRPRTVREIISPKGKVMESFTPSVKNVIKLNPDELAIVKEGLVKVVNDMHGTAKRAKLKDIVVAGKTGTIQVSVQGEKHTHAWFACFAPAEKPEIVVVLLVEYGKSGGQAAAPLVQKVLEAYFYRPSLTKEDIEKENAA